MEVVQTGGVKSLPEFQRSKEQVVVSDMAYDTSQMSPENMCFSVCVTDKGRGLLKHGHKRHVYQK